MLNWNWNYKIGEITVEQECSFEQECSKVSNETKVSNKTFKFKVDIYEANCLFAVIYRFKSSVDPNEDGLVFEDSKNFKTKDSKKPVKEWFQVYSFFNDLKHLKRCLPLFNCRIDPKGDSEESKLRASSIDTWTKIKLNTWFNSKNSPCDVMKVAEVLAKAGFKVELYYKEPKCEKYDPDDPRSKYQKVKI